VRADRFAALSISEHLARCRRTGGRNPGEYV